MSSSALKIGAVILIIMTMFLAYIGFTMSRVASQQTKQDSALVKVEDLDKVEYICPQGTFQEEGELFSNTLRYVKRSDGTKVYYPEICIVKLFPK